MFVLVAAVAGLVMRPAGVTLINFALFDLVGKVLSPRIRDLGKITLMRDSTPAETRKLYPHAGPLLSARWNEDLVADCWGDLLRMAGSLKYGQATASLIVGKWPAASRQNILAAALKEWGTLRRTIHAARYLSELCVEGQARAGYQSCGPSAQSPIRLAKRPTITLMIPSRASTGRTSSREGWLSVVAQDNSTPSGAARPGSISPQRRAARHRSVVQVG